MAVETADLPAPRGPLTDALVRALREPAGSDRALDAAGRAAAGGGALEDDVQLALHLCYELHYRGFRDVDAAWEWNPGLLALRARLEDRFLAELRALTPAADVPDALDALQVEYADERGASHHLADEGSLGQLREYLVHRSMYQLKEADPHTFAIPRLSGGPKAAFMAVQFDEYGGGRPERMHARLFADLLEEAGLDPSYGAYLDAVPAPMLAITNAMSLFALHRALRGALVGHFAAVEVTSPPGAARMVAALRRLGIGERGQRFYAEHVEADAVHEQVMRRDVVGGLLAAEPELAGDVAFGAGATALLERRLDDHLLGCWRESRSSLLRPVDEPAESAEPAEPAGAA
ncbi:iron-containing redox enzyme family protein [Actinomadura atramentaria]|uniref:iron-containing redox enzyme family protein n=1 Tax=Actinomadura atramentaria TaxID=1990 RepID=UPI000371F4D5|nr:iron-containing redox enzyme family protein [Actinomadura atramentaria]